MWIEKSVTIIVAFHFIKRRLETPAERFAFVSHICETGVKRTKYERRAGIRFNLHDISSLVVVTDSSACYCLQTMNFRYET